MKKLFFSLIVGVIPIIASADQFNKEQQADTLYDAMVDPSQNNANPLSNGTSQGNANPQTCAGGSCQTNGNSQKCAEGNCPEPDILPGHASVVDEISLDSRFPNTTDKPCDLTNCKEQEVEFAAPFQRTSPYRWSADPYPD